MRTFFFGLASLVALTCGGASADAGVSKQLGELLKKRTASPSGVVPLSTRTYHQYVTSERDYHTLVFFTATNAACAACRAANEPLEAVADSLRRAFPEGPVDGEPMSRVIVAKADYPKCQEVFQTHPNLTGVPHLVLVPPGPAAPVPPEQLRGSTKWLPGFSGRNEYSLASQQIDPADIMGWVHKRMRAPGSPPQIYVDPIPGIIRMILLIVSVPTIIIGSMALIGARRICMSFAVVMMFFILGGGLYCLIRGSPPSNGADFMFRYSGNQTQTEGFIVAFFTALGSLGVIILNSDNAVGDKAKDRSLGGLSKGELFTGAFTVVSAFAFYQLRALYIAKSPGYLTYTA